MAAPLVNIRITITAPALTELARLTESLNALR